MDTESDSGRAFEFSKPIALESVLNREGTNGDETKMDGSFCYRIYSFTNRMKLPGSDLEKYRGRENDGVKDVWNKNETVSILGSMVTSSADFMSNDINNGGRGKWPKQQFLDPNFSYNLESVQSYVSASDCNSVPSYRIDPVPKHQVLSKDGKCQGLLVFNDGRPVTITVVKADKNGNFMMNSQRTAPLGTFEEESLYLDTGEFMAAVFQYSSHLITYSKMKNDHPLYHESHKTMPLRLLTTFTPFYE